MVKVDNNILHEGHQIKSIIDSIILLVVCSVMFMLIHAMNKMLPMLQMMLH